MFDPSNFIAILVACAAAGVTALGLLGAWINADWAKKNSGLLAAFAAGALICVVLLHLAPEAMAMTASASLWMVFGFFFGFLLNRGVLSLGRANGAEVASAITPVLAIACHSFVDGVVYAVNFSVSATTGGLTAIGLVLHEAPEGVIVFSLLQRAGLTTKKALAFAFLAAGATTPLGAIVATPLVSLISADMLGALFAATSGLLLYIAAAHLIPHVEREPFVRAVPALGLGAAVAVGASLTHSHHDHTEPHDHHHHDHSSHADAADPTKRGFARPRDAFY